MARPSCTLPRELVGPDAPLRLEVAAALAYPDGSMTASGLRKEARKGRLVIERTAGKDYTTLAAIEEMRALCRVHPKDRDFGSAKPDAIDAGASPIPPYTSSETANYQQGTSCSQGDRGGAERALEAYLNAKHAASAKKGARDPDQIPVADVLALYGTEIAPCHARPKEAAQRLERLLAFFGGRKLAEINGNLCREFVKARSTPTAARDDLTVLRAAINHHRREGYHDRIVSVVLPKRPPAASAG